MTFETCPIFAEFLRDHPEFAGDQYTVEMPDGSPESCISVAGMEAFARWCLFNGHGDPKKVVEFLATILPQLKAMDRELKESGPTRATGPEATSG